MKKENSDKKVIVVALSNALAKTPESEKVAQSLFSNIDGLLTNTISTVKQAVYPVIQATLETPDAEGVAYPLIDLINGKYGKGFGKWFSSFGFKIEKAEDGYTITGFKYPEGAETPADVVAMAEGEPLDIVHTPEPKDDKAQKKVKSWGRLDAGVIEDIRKVLKKKIASEYKNHKASSRVQTFVNEYLLSEDFVRDTLADYLAKNK